MFVPEVLKDVADMMVGHSRISVTQPWRRVGNGLWALKVVARLSVPEALFMPTETNWYLVLDLPSTSVTIFPAKEGGITATHQHQSFNEEGPAALPWRRGNLCLQRQAAAFDRAVWAGEPDALEPKVCWYIERLLIWIDAAASGQLALPGEPLELPTGPGQKSVPVVGFTSSSDDLEFWQPLFGQWGWADIVDIPGTHRNYGIAAFRNTERKLIRKVNWGRLIATQAPTGTALWIALDRLPVIAPWELPRSWTTLTGCLETMGVDLGNILVRAGSGRRHQKRDSDPVRMLLGFPLSRTIGAAPSHYHWLALDSLELANLRTKKNGFRPNERTWRLIDRSRASSNSSLNWLRTANWAPEEIRTRSGPASVVPARRVLVIGAGSLGSAVAENLVRMGLTELGLLDADVLETGNLTRHALGLDGVGRNKAMALSAALNLTMPDANVTGFASSFPPADTMVADQLRSFDVIVDCTASDRVLDALSNFDWEGEKTFVSMGMTWKAEGLFVFAASETAFPAVDAKERFAALESPQIDLDDACREGIGCWHPVFPADASDVRLWSAIGSKAILRAMLSPGRMCQYFRLRADGTAERQDA